MTLITGIPNAGKTTYSMRYPNVIHFDFMDGGRHRREKIINLVQADNSLCVEGVYCKSADRRKLVEASKEHNTCIWINTPLDVCIDRELNGRNRSVQMVRWAYERYEPPTYSEGWDEIIIIGEQHG